MKIFQRNLNLVELPLKIKMFFIILIRACFVFKNPLFLLFKYIKLAAFSENKHIKLRNGFKIYVSPHNMDLLTVIVVFCKRDYGIIKKGSTVIDIGANIGIFSLFAAYMGAEKVFAFEPNKAAYKYLLQNVRENNLEKVIVPINMAVTGNDNAAVKIPLAYSPQNKTQSCIDEELCSEYEIINTISLKGILERYSINHVDMLKLDCEGAEYEIIHAAKASTFFKIKDIRMEYHQGSVNTLVSNLKKYAFRVVKFKPETSQMGNIWFSKF